MQRSLLPTPGLRLGALSSCCCLLTCTWHVGAGWNSHGRRCAGRAGLSTAASCTPARPPPRTSARCLQRTATGSPGLPPTVVFTSCSSRPPSNLALSVGGLTSRGVRLSDSRLTPPASRDELCRLSCAGSDWLTMLPASAAKSSRCDPTALSAAVAAAVGGDAAAGTAVAVVCEASKLTSQFKQLQAGGLAVVLRPTEWQAEPKEVKVVERFGAQIVFAEVEDGKEVEEEEEVELALLASGAVEVAR